MYLPYDIELIIYRYLHEMKMISIRKELKETLIFITDCKNFFRLYIPKLFMERFYKCDFFNNPFFSKTIHKYIHSRKMSDCFSQLV
uniref:Uncharacterized protein n=1 Tax=viral metagenome TaxID=1070528 RepID=A0A6C0DDF1_9ZZZZ